MLSDADRLIVEKLTALIRGIRTMSEDEASARLRASMQADFDRLASRAREVRFSATQKGVFQASSQETFRAELREIDNDLHAQIRLVLDGIENYEQNGLTPPPYYPWRIAIILRKAKEYRLEAEFLDAFSAKFPGGKGGKFQDIAERAKKARALAEKH